MTLLTVESAIQAVRDGADYRLNGTTFTVNGIAMALQGDEFDRVWDALEELEGDDYSLSLASGD